MYLDGVVLIGSQMRPTASIRADHVCSMADRSKYEPITLGLHYLLVAHSQCQPVAD